MLPGGASGSYSTKIRTIYSELTKLGAATRVAGISRCWWRNSNGDIKRVQTIVYFDKLGVLRLSWSQLLEPPGADPYAGWCGMDTA